MEIMFVNMQMLL